MKINKITIKKLSPSGGSSFLSLIKSKIPCKSELLSRKSKLQPCKKELLSCKSELLSHKIELRPYKK